MPIALLILETLGTQELLLILAVALIFFGPRKLPQISRQIGKSLAEFRKASEDFKRTWEREVALETESAPPPERSILPENSTLTTAVERSEPVLQPHSTESDFEGALVGNPGETNQAERVLDSAGPSEPTRKHDWL